MLGGGGWRKRNARDAADICAGCRGVFLPWLEEWRECRGGREREREDWHLIPLLDPGGGGTETSNEESRDKL